MRTNLPSLDIIIPRGLCPTFTVLITFFFFISITLTVLSFSLVIYARLALAIEKLIANNNVGVKKNLIIKIMY